MPLRVLVVDDSRAMRVAIQRVLDLSCLPLKCFTAQHGNAALSLLQNQEIDLMLVDLNMPEMSGSDLIRRLQENPVERQIPFIVISADATATRIEEMLNLGAVAYIHKPFDPSTLRTEMRRALDEMHARN